MTGQVPKENPKEFEDKYIQNEGAQMVVEIINLSFTGSVDLS